MDGFRDREVNSPHGLSFVSFRDSWFVWFRGLILVDLSEKPTAKPHEHKTNSHECAGVGWVWNKNRQLPLRRRPAAHLLLDQLSRFTMTVSVPVTIPNLFSKPV